MRGDWEREGVKKIIRKGLVYICVIVGTGSTKGSFCETETSAASRWVHGIFMGIYFFALAER